MEFAVKLRIVIAVFMSSQLMQAAFAAAPPLPQRTCDTDSTQQLLTCLKHCSSRVNDASTRVCKQQCMDKNEARKAQCVKPAKPRLIIL
jgi:hypothetical protein